MLSRFAFNFSLRRYNEGTGGVEVVAQGAGVVMFVQLSTTREEDDPASAAPSGFQAVVARAETLHRNRVELARQGDY